MSSQSLSSRASLAGFSSGFTGPIFFTGATGFFGGTGTSSQSPSTHFFTGFADGTFSQSSLSSTASIADFTDFTPFADVTDFTDFTPFADVTPPKPSLSPATGLGAFGRGGFDRTTSFLTDVESSCQIESSSQSKASSMLLLALRSTLFTLRVLAAASSTGADTSPQSLSLFSAAAPSSEEEEEEEKGRSLSESRESLPNKQGNHQLLNNTRRGLVFDRPRVDRSFLFLHPLQILLIHLCNHLQMIQHRF